MKKRSVIIAAAAVIPALATLSGCIHTEQEPMPPGVYIQAPAPDTAAAPMPPPSSNDSFQPAPQAPVLPPAPEVKADKKDGKKAPAVKGTKTVKKGKKAAVRKTPVKFRAAEEKYIVKKGDSLSRIAYRYGISVKALQEYNKLKTTIIRPKQVLLIPASKAVPAKAKAAAPAGKKAVKGAKKVKGGAAKKPGAKEVSQGNVHIVRSGEDFTRIARLYKLKVSDIQKANPGVDSRRLRIGQKLNLVPGAKAVTAAAPAAAPAPAPAAPATKTPAPAPAPAATDPLDDKFITEGVKDPLAAPAKKGDAAPAAAPAPAVNPDDPSLDLGATPAALTDEVVTMDGGKQAVTIRTKATTIDALAKRFNSTPEKIREANGLLPADGTIKLGTRVIIP